MNGTNIKTSWPGLSGPSTSFLFDSLSKEDVDDPHKAGHDDWLLGD